MRLASHDIEATLRRFEIILVKGIDADIPGIADRHKVDSIQRLTYSIMLTAFLLNGDYPKFATQYAHEFRDDVEIKFYRMLVREAYKSCDLATAIMLYDAHRTRYGKTTMSALI